MQKIKINTPVNTEQLFKSKKANPHYNLIYDLNPESEIERWINLTKNSRINNHEQKKIHYRSRSECLTASQRKRASFSPTTHKQKMDRISLMCPTQKKPITPRDTSRSNNSVFFRKRYENKSDFSTDLIFSESPEEKHTASGRLQKKYDIRNLITRSREQKRQGFRVEGLRLI